MAKKLRLFDLFCGTGGFSKGFEKAESTTFETIIGVDVLPIAIETFRKNHPQAKAICGDIRQVKLAALAEELRLKKGDLDIIIGGPPCQGFSSIRPFRSSNEDDPRNSLFEQFANFVNFFRPKALVMENVVGLATFNGGETIQQIQECFVRLGYNCDWKIINAANFGVPQKRERLILIGVQNGADVNFPIPTHITRGATIGFKDRSRMLTTSEPDLFSTPSTPNLQIAVSVMDAIGDLPEIEAGEIATAYSREPRHYFQRERRKGAKMLTLHDATAHTPKMMEIIRHSGKNISAIPSHLITSGFSSCYSRLDADEPAVTITVNFVHPASNRCIHPIQHRALSPREGARLQSFDDTFEFEGTRSQIVKQIGNAVPPLLGKAIAEPMGEVLKGS